MIAPRSALGLLVVLLVATAAVALWISRGDPPPPGIGSIAGADAGDARGSASHAAGAAAAPPSPEAGANRRSADAPRSATTSTADEAWTISGMCQDVQGRPVANVRVVLFRPTPEDGPRPPARTTQTDPSGQFALVVADGSPANGIVRFDGDGFVRAQTRLTAPDLERGPQVQLGAVVLERGHRAGGRVVDTDGNPVSDFTVEWRRAPGSEPDALAAAPKVASARTDARGEFTFHQPLAEGPWRVLPALRRGFPGHPAPLVQPLEDLDVRAPLRAEITILPQLRLSGSVRDPQGAPVFAWIRTADGQPLTHTQQDGTFAEARFAPGGIAEPFALRVEAEGHATLTTAPRFTWGMTGIDLVLTPATARTIELRDADDGSLRSDLTARVAAPPTTQGGPGPRRPEVEATEPGRFAVRALDPTRYDVIVGFADGSPGVCGPFPLAPPHDGAAPVAISIPARIAQPVRVVDGSGAAVAGARLRLLRRLQPHGALPRDPSLGFDTLQQFVSGPEAGLAASAVTDAEGQAELVGWQAPPGETGGHVLHVEHALHAPLVQEWSFGTQPATARMAAGAALEIAVGPLEVVRALWDMSGHAPGPNASGGPAITLQNGRTTRRAVLPLSGTLEIDGLEPGIWPLDAWTPVRGAGGQSAHLFSREIELPAGARQRLELDATDWMPGALEGRVTVNGEARKRTVTLTAIGQPAVSPHFAVPTHLQLATDGDGRFTVPGLPPGQWRISVEVTAQPKQLVDVATPVVIAPGRTVEWHGDQVSVALAVRCLDRDGAPHAGAILVPVVDGRPLTERPVTDGEGRASLTLPPGPVRLLVLPAGVTIAEATRDWGLARSGQIATPCFLEVHFDVAAGDGQGAERVLRTP